MSKVVDTKVTVLRSSFGVVNQEEEVIDVREFKTTPAMVKVGMHRVVNLGDYNSLKVEVAVEIPCYAEEVTSVMSKATQFCEKRLNKQITAMES